ncbi:hypothetical protein PoB_006663300 [Plakobranchus ocellatus]|uniref:IgGFc-binding protein N-terminal domain-containing protein n=1 Tax=Plakobranchus ocellatus TaxID=259542 RepID=A0AAV4D7I2_9GAST|nr:hypothetical protein PoB_006663300 [Plakobranchus ocellatus]
MDYCPAASDFSDLWNRSNVGREFIVFPEVNFQNSTTTASGQAVIVVETNAHVAQVEARTPLKVPPLLSEYIHLSGGVSTKLPIPAVSSVNKTQVYDTAIYLTASADVSVFVHIPNSNETDRILLLPLNWAGTLYIFHAEK